MWSAGSSDSLIEKLTSQTEGEAKEKSITTARRRHEPWIPRFPSSSSLRLVHLHGI